MAKQKPYHVKKRDITPNEIALLKVLSTMTDEWKSPGEVRGRRKFNVPQTLDHLFKRGYVRRRDRLAGKGHKAIFEYRATEEGLEFLEKLK